MQFFKKAPLISRCLVIVTITIFAGARIVFAQTAPPLTPVIPPSPNMQAMQKYGDIPVSAYTGIPNISIPLYTIKFHDITVPISISYHASGIKVSEEASNVGLGWVLNAGGSISRTIIGYDDFFTGDGYPNADYFGAFNSLDFADGFHPNGANVQFDGTVNFINSITGNQTSYDISNNLPGSEGEQIEFQPDQFYYNVPGLNGKFLLRRNGKAILQTPSKIDIEHSSDGSAWDIYNVDGFQYYFDTVETSRSITEATSVHHISAVYLTKIKSPQGDSVVFRYTIDPSNYVQSLGSWTQSRNDIIIPDPNFLSGLSMNLVAPTASAGNAQVYSSVYLTEIDYGSGQVQFSYSNNRTDTQNDKQLNSITVYSKDAQGNLVATAFRTINMAYSYFSGSQYPNPGVYATSSFYQQRLRLDSLTISGANNGQLHSENPYRFSYYSPNGGANKSSFSRDSWGYFNGSGASSLLPSYVHANSSDNIGIPDATRYPNATYLQDFTLSDIQYPTGGTTHFDYEPNDCDEQKSETHDAAGYSTSDIYSVVPSPNGPYSGMWAPGQTTMPDADLTDIYSDFSSFNTVTVGFIFNSTPQPALTLNQVGLNFVNQNNQVVQTVDAAYGAAVVTVQGNTTSILVTMPLPGPGIYHVVPYCTSTYSTSLWHMSANVNWYTQVNDAPGPSVTHPTTYSLAGGLRIKRITDNDGINPPVIKRYIYHYNVGQANEESYGIRMSRPEYSYFERSNDSYTQETDNGWQTTNYQDEFVMRISDSNIPLNGSAQGNVVGYTQVTENYGENGENGKTVYQYYNQPDYIPPFIYASRPRKRPYNSDIADPLNGSLLEQTDYKNVNGQFDAVKDITNTYYVDLSQQNYVYAVEDHVEQHCNYMNNVASGVNYTPITPQDRYENIYSPLQTEWTYQTIKDEKDYNSDNLTNFTESQTNYYYDNPNHYLPTRTVTTNSKGEVITNWTKYPLDFNYLTGSDAIAPGVNQLIKNNIFDAPVEKYTQKTAADGSNLRVIGGSITAYTASGLSSPSKVYELETAIPLTNFNSYATSGTLNNAYQPAINFKFDGANGNLLQQNKQYDANNAYLWGYNNVYPVAQAVNASQNDIFFDSFEEGDGNSALGDAKTGHYSFSGSYSKALSGLDAGTYTLSYWSKTGSVWALVVNTNVSVSGSTHTISLSGQIDDVRFYPSAAQMTTYTYDPNIGVTSVSDPKCDISFYEYDGLGRLQNIKDKDGNIVKSFCYNYAGQPYGCTVPQTVYSNNPQSGIFTVNNCAAGSTGSQVTYTVPTGKYTSLISQADADQQAQNDVTQNGQAYANANGSCIPNITFTITNRTTVPYEINFSAGPASYTFDFGNVANYQVSVPAGTYYLNVYPQGSSTTSYNITLGDRNTVTAPRTGFNGVNISTGSTDLTLTIQ